MKTVICVVLAGLARAGDIHLDCNASWELSFAGSLRHQIESVPGAGRSNGALKLKCPNDLGYALFLCHEQTSVEDVAAPIRVTVWVKGDAHGGVGFLCYDAKRRYLAIDPKPVPYEVKAADGWKQVVMDYIPAAGSDYCNRIAFVTPYLTCSAGETVLVDDVSLEFLVAGREVRIGKSPALPLDESATPRDATPCVPRVKTAPKMTGAFDPADWKTAVCLDRFVVLKTKDRPAPEKTSVLLCRDAKTLFAALVMDCARVAELAKRCEKDLAKAPWALPGVECTMGREGSFLHLAFDYMGRFYSNGEIRLYVSTDYADMRVVVRFALPLDQLPREKASDLVTRMNFYRKSASGSSSWRFNARELFADMKATGQVNLATEAEVAADIRAQAEARAALLARGDALKAKYGTVGGKVEKWSGGEVEKWSGGEVKRCWEKVEPLWKPAKVFGRDYWNSVLTMHNTFDRFRAAGIADDAFIREAIIWLWWERCTDELLDPNGWAQKVVREHPESAVAVKTMDRLYMDASQRARPDIVAYWDKDYAEKFLSVYDGGNGRFLGFWEDEAFVNGTGVFAEYLEKLRIPKPKNRDEAYKAFATCYNWRSETVPEITPFRNVANASPYFHKYACNSAAATFNHFTSALGDMMSGNETGDCMGSNPPKFAIARGAARQWGRPWRNYQTYYQWAFVADGEKRSKGLRCIYDHSNLLKPGCRYDIYFCDGPDIGTDEARHKNTFLYPYFCGCGVYSSEANHGEMLQWYDDEEIKTADPMCVALRDARPGWISPLARTNRHFYDEIVKKRDRGVTLTPIGVVFDRASGYAPLYFGGNVWDFFAPTEMEQTMWAFNTHVFKPYAVNDYYATSAFGDVFDIITNDATEDFLKTYPVLMPIGDVTLDAAFAKKLRAYVEAGGTLVLNAALALKYPQAFDAAFLGAKIGEEPAKSVGTYSRLSGRQILEETAYVYRSLTPNAGVETLAVTADGEAPVLILNRVGKGRVILTAPDNMKPSGSRETMLKLFDDLLMALRNEALPLRVEAEANVEYAVARNGTSFLVYLNNNNGIPTRSGVHKTPPKTDVTKRAGAKIAIPERLGKVVRAFDWWTGAAVPFKTETTDGETRAIAETTLPGGDCAVIEFVVE